MRIIQSARKHAIADADMIHAVEKAIRSFHQQPQQEAHSVITIYVGPAQNGALLEIGVIYSKSQSDHLIVHAMPHRPHKYPIR